MSEAIPLLQGLLERRSIRKYTDQPVTRDELAAILEAGRWAPSGKNNQPWKFLVVKAGDPRQKSLAGCTHYDKIVLGAAALIAVFLDKERMYHPMKDHQAAGACIQNMLLAAHGLGLGAVWLGEIVNQADQVMDLLDLDGKALELMAVIALGRPAAKGASSRRELDELMLEDF